MEDYAEAPVFTPVKPDTRLAAAHPTCSNALVEDIFATDEQESDQ